MATSRIEWTEQTWNPVTGCDKISAGCKYCYAERMATRLHAMKNPRYFNNFEVTLHHDLLDAPLHWKKPRTIFVNSMSDVFHPAVPAKFIRSLFDVVNDADWHTFQILTKRSGRLHRLAPLLRWPYHAWMGVSVENQDAMYRIDDLAKTPARIKFLSIEPLLGPLPCLALDGIDWVIVGGESGPKARPMNPAWVRDIRDQCVRKGVPFFFKQWGGVNKKKTGRVLDGRTWDEMPIIDDRKKLSRNGLRGTFQ